MPGLAALVAVLLATAAHAQAPDSTSGCPTSGRTDPPAVAFSGRLSTHARVYPQAGADGPPSAFLVRRARVEATFRPLRGVTVVVEPDFGENEVDLVDGWAEVVLGGGVALRAGRFKTPFVREAVASSTALWFAERAFPTALSPRRDVGALVTWQTDRVEAAVGVFNGVGDGSSESGETGPQKDVAGRVTVALPGGLSAGLAATAGTEREAGRLADYETPDDRPLFAYADPVVADGRRLRLSPDLAWARGPLAVRAEAAWAQHRVRPGTGAAVRQTHRAWQVAAAWALGGTPQIDGAPRVDRPVDAGGPGGWLLSARVHGLHLDPSAAALADPETDTRRALGVAAAVHWLATDRVRLGATAEHIDADGLDAPWTLTVHADLSL